MTSSWGEAQPLQRPFELVERGLGRVMAVQAQHMLDVLDHRIQGTVRMVRQPAEPDAGVAFPCHVRAQYLDQGSFANTGFPAEEHHLPQPNLTLLPAAQEEPEFFLTP